MEHITYSKVNHKKGQGKPLKTPTTELDVPTIVYADIRTCSSQIHLPENDPGTDAPQKWQSHKTLILFLILILVIVLLSTALIYFVYHHVDKENDRKYQELRQDLCVNETHRSTGCLLCPYGWFLHGDDCYYYSDVSDRTWNQSRDHCKMMGADLVAIKDKEQEEIIQRSLRQWGEDLYWIGLHYDGDDWRWADGEPYNSSLLQIQRGPSGHCLSLTTSGYYQRTCNSTYRWICQKKAVRI
ncbi:killer cell lectin-like receptor subfamily B member 1B allele B [Leptodactylus fuscus]|uniref:killer cell lectin-like receptor subfamily B member 1B allele B n=1 Tax=Leptodactylus fuscus TaxID=238119 RepID=UPI003F4E9861